MILKINSQNPEKRKINQVIEVLKKGGIIAYPTDTSYGIGCDLNNKKAISKIYQILHLPKDKHLSFLCPNLSNVSEYAVVSNIAYKTMKRVIPGPYTFILDAAKTVPSALLSKRKQVGIRVPDNQICLTIIEELGNPLINKTAKKENGEYFLDAQEIKEQLGHTLDLIIESDKTIKQGKSTIIDFSDMEVKLKREGLGDSSWLIED